MRLLIRFGDNLGELSLQGWEKYLVDRQGDCVKNIFKIIAIAAALVFVSPATASVADEVRVVGDGAIWCWEPYSDKADGVSELTIFTLEAVDCDDWDNEILGDGYDGFGYLDIGGVRALEDQVSRTFDKNWVEYVISAGSSDSLEITGNMGSDGGTRWVSLDGRLFSYQRCTNDDKVYTCYDPIFMWETDGSITYADSDDDPDIIKTGTSLRLKHYAYAYETNEDFGVDDFFSLFSQWVAQNIERTDIFTSAWLPGKDTTFWRSVENCRLDFGKAVTAGASLSVSAYQSCFFTGVNSSNLASVNAQLQALMSAAVKSGTPMSHNDVIRAAGVIADRLDLVQRLSTGKLVYAAEFEPLGITISTKTLDALMGQSADQIDTWEEVVALAARL